VRRFILLLLALLAALLLILQPAGAQAPVTVTVVSASLKVRAAPSSEAEQLGLLQRGAKVVISGVSADGYWLHFSFWGAEAWIGSAPELVTVEGEVDALPVMDTPSSASPRLVDFSLHPAVPVPGESFRLKLMLSSREPTAPFVVAGALEESFFLLPVQFLAGAGTHQIETEVVAPKQTGWFELHLALDVENALGKGKEETLKVFVDYPRTLKGRLRLEAFTNYNPDEGAADVSWDGDSLKALNEAKLGVMPVPLSEAHYDAVLAERDSVPRRELKEKGLMSLWTNEGRRALLWVRALEGNALVLEVFLYEGVVNAD